MPDLGPHADFILAAYGVTLIAVTALVLAIVADDRHQRHVLAELEKKGIRRRSAKASDALPAARKPEPQASRRQDAKAERMSKPAPSPARRRLSLLLPLLVFAALSGLFWFALQGGDPSTLPSALIGKPVPQFTLPPVEGLERDGEGVAGLCHLGPCHRHAHHRQCLGVLVRALP